MKILLIGSAVPYRNHGQEGVTATHIVSYELLKGLVSLEHEIFLQLIFNQFRGDSSLQPSEESELNHLKEQGVVVLPPIYGLQYQKSTRSSSPLRKLGRLMRLLRGQVRIEDYYPTVRVREIVGDRIESHQADAILTIWSPEGMAATYGLRQVPKIAYHGDVDFIPSEMRMKDKALFLGIAEPAKTGVASLIRQGLREFVQKVSLREFKQAHLRLMRDVDVIANVTASNAEFYSQQGHPISIYIRNVWSDPGIKQVSIAKDNLPHRSSEHPIKIIGHIGYLNRTGGTYGLKFLLVDVVPKLKEMMKGLNYQIHIIGGGDVVPTLKPYLQQEHIVIQGFVEDLDRELKSSDMFLLLNNAGPYQAAYTRHIVAWSMGLCLIVHGNSKKAMPEITHGENALVGSTANEVAQMIFLAATDSELNLRVRQGGRNTYQKYFKSLVVAEALSQEMGRLVAKSPSCQEQ
ncbi:MAG: glycosyltransferase family 4 protein [Xenococcaceae cyanobacterium]